MTSQNPGKFCGAEFDRSLFSPFIKTYLIFDGRTFLPGLPEIQQRENASLGANQKPSRSLSPIAD